MLTDKITHNFDINRRLERRLIEREHEFASYKKFYILIGTFNVNNQSAPNSSVLEEWLFREMNKIDDENRTHAPDIVAVGFQEIDTSSSAYIYDDKKKEDNWEQCVRASIQSAYKCRNDHNKFLLLSRIRLMGILLIVYVLPVHMQNCTSVSQASLPTGFMGVAGNKGGVGIRFRFYETDLCFINCHLAAGDSQIERRNSDYQTIESKLNFSRSSSASRDFVSYAEQNDPAVKQNYRINEHDLIFWFGDMNYRIGHNNDHVRTLVRNGSLSFLQEKDQLISEMKKNRVFRNYVEAAISFTPTYKFNPRSDIYDTSDKMRTPSWTDRILCRCKTKIVRPLSENEQKTVESLDYRSSKSIRFSDHRPVSSLFSAILKISINEKAFLRIREEIFRQIDREDNSNIPTIELTPRNPKIDWQNVRFFDRRIFSFKVKNRSDFTSSFSILTSNQMANNTKNVEEEPLLDCLTFSPNSPFSLDVDEELTIEIAFQIKSQYIWLFGKRINEILILHLDNGADTFITVDIELDMGPFGMGFDQFSPTFYDISTKKYIEFPSGDHQIVPMVKEPPVLFISLVETLKSRQDFQAESIFSGDTNETLDLGAIRDQIYLGHYEFESFSTIEIFFILLHLLRSLPEPIVSREVQSRIFLSANYSTSNTFKHSVNHSIENYIPDEANSKKISLDRNQLMIVVTENPKVRERNFVLRFLSFLQKVWPNQEIIRRFNDEQRTLLNQTVDVVSRCILHDCASQENRRAFLLSYLTEEKKKKS